MAQRTCRWGSGASASSTSTANHFKSRFLTQQPTASYAPQCLGTQPKTAAINKSRDNTSPRPPGLSYEAPRHRLDLAGGIEECRDNQHPADPRARPAFNVAGVNTWSVAKCSTAQAQCQHGSHSCCPLIKAALTQRLLQFGATTVPIAARPRSMGGPNTLSPPMKKKLSGPAFAHGTKHPPAANTQLRHVWTTEAGPETPQTPHTHTQRAHILILLLQRQRHNSYCSCCSSCCCSEGSPAGVCCLDASCHLLHRQGPQVRPAIQPHRQCARLRLLGAHHRHHGGLCLLCCADHLGD